MKHSFMPPSLIDLDGMVAVAGASPGNSAFTIGHFRVSVGQAGMRSEAERHGE